MKKHLAIFCSILLLSTAVLPLTVFATTRPGTFSDVAIILELEEGYSVGKEEGKKQATPGIQYTIENGSLVLQDYYGRGASKIALPRHIGSDENGPLYMNYIAQGAFVGTGLKAVYLPDCLMMSTKEILAVDPVTGEGIYFDADTEVYTFSGDPDLSKMTNVKNLRETEEDPVVPVNPADQETKQPTSHQSGDFRYTDYGPYVEITGYTGSSLSVTVPSNLGGLPVKAVTGSVFSMKKYDLVQIPTGVSVNGQINAKKTILNYDSAHPIVAEEKTYETDAEGQTYSLEDIIVIEGDDLTTLPEELTEEGSEAKENESSSESGSQNESSASASGEVTTESSGENGEKKESDTWMWILVGLGGAAVLAGAGLMIKTAADGKKK